MNRPGIAVMRHARDFAQLRLVKGRVGDHNGKRRVSGKLVLSNPGGLFHIVHGTAQSRSFPVQQPGDLSARLPVMDIPQRVEGDDRADLYFAQLNGIAADPCLHGCFHAGNLPDRGAASGAVIAVPVIRGFHGALRGFIAHGRVRPDGRITDRQVIEIRLRHQRHPGEPRIISDAVFLQICHHPVGGSQTVRAAARQNNRVNLLHRHQRVQQLALTGSRPSAAHVEAGTHAFLTNQYRTSGGGCFVFRLADSDGPDLRYGDFLHPAIHSFRSHCHPDSPTEAIRPSG